MAKDDDKARAVTLNDLNDDPTLVQQLDLKDCVRLVQAYEAGESILAGSLAQELDAKLREHLAGKDK